MKRCIYGVDLNDMAVELAKLSLWLDSFTLGAPLSFFDHHLKWGNSLIGVTIEDLEEALSGELFGINLEPLKRAIRNMLFISDLPDATLAQVRESYEKYAEANVGLEGYRILLDLLVAKHFGIPEAKEMLVMGINKIDLNNLKASLSNLTENERELIEKVEALAKEKRFFHWEIEFPEVFYEQIGELGQKVDKKGNQGFDCVIGNPPWGADFKDSERQLFKAVFKDIIVRMIDSYMYFIKKSHDLSKNYSYVGIIVPNPFLTQIDMKKLRSHILERCTLTDVIDLGDGVFGSEFANPSCVVIFKTKINNGTNVKISVTIQRKI